MRIRNKYSPRYYSEGYSPGNITTTVQDDHLEYMYDSIGSKRPYRPVVHASRKVPGQFKYVKRGRFTDQHVSYENVSGTHYVCNAATSAINSFNNDYAFELEFQRDDDFQILMFIFEFEELLELFTLKFWRSFSYGSYTWAILPIVSDLISLLNTWKTLVNGDVAKELSNWGSGRRINREVRFTAERLVNGDVVSFEGFIYLQGHARSFILSDYAPLEIFLDELGFHPDLRTVWDLIPLSFLVDYFLPIGEILESFHPRGWFNPVVTYNGNCTMIADFSYKIPAPPFWTTLEETPATGRCYSRQVGVNFSTSTRKPVTIDYSLPSMREVLNTAYVFRRTLSKSRILGRL